jgi:hypothetical protein
LRTGFDNPIEQHINLLSDLRRFTLIYLGNRSRLLPELIPSVLTQSKDKVVEPRTRR